MTRRILSQGVHPGTLLEIGAAHQALHGAAVMAVTVALNVLLILLLIYFLSRHLFSPKKIENDDSSAPCPLLREAAVAASYLCCLFSLLRKAAVVSYLCCLFSLLRKAAVVTSYLCCLFSCTVLLQTVSREPSTARSASQVSRTGRSAGCCHGATTSSRLGLDG